MNISDQYAEHTCKAGQARQAVVIWFYEYGYSIGVYGETKAENDAAEFLGDASGDALDDGSLPNPIPKKNLTNEET